MNNFTFFIHDDHTLIKYFGWDNKDYGFLFELVTCFLLGPKCEADKGIKSRNTPPQDHAGC